MTVHLETHVAVWLYLGHVDRLSARARLLVDSDAVFVSPVVGVELDLLFEIGRTVGPSDEVLTGLARSLGLSVSTAAFPAVAAAAGSSRGLGTRSIG